MNIGVFDSGVGGLWILKHLIEGIPGCNFIFLGDQGHVPYGSKSIEEIRNYSVGITDFLIKNNCKIIVIACNTASATSLNFLRNKYPDILFVGMEPAIKPAVLSTLTNKIGVLATPVTFGGDLYNSVVERFREGVEIFEDSCTGLVGQIENGDLSSYETKRILEKAISPMIKEGIDTLVLSCTHYPFVIPLIKEVTNNQINIIDPTLAIVRRVSTLIFENSFLCENENKVFLDLYTTGEKENMSKFASNLFNRKIEVNKLSWDENLILIK